MTGREDDSFEELLGSALHDCIDASPRTGLEQRILARVQAEAASPIHNPLWRYLAVALPLLVLGAFVALHYGEISSQSKSIESTAVKMTPRLVGPQVVIMPKAEAQNLPAYRVVKAALPRSDVFPAQRSMSKAERILEEIAVQYPQQAEALPVLEPPKPITVPAVTIEPIRITAIVIKPISRSQIDSDQRYQ